MVVTGSRITIISVRGVVVSLILWCSHGVTVTNILASNLVTNFFIRGVYDSTVLEIFLIKAPFL